MENIKINSNMLTFTLNKEKFNCFESALERARQIITFFNRFDEYKSFYIQENGSTYDIILFFVDTEDDSEFADIDFEELEEEF